MTDLHDKTVVITGATSGIGQAAALALARQGARVFVVGRDQARGAAVVQEVLRSGGTGDFLAANMLSLHDIARLADELLARTPSLDVLINNAGGTFRTRTTSADMIEATFALNTVAAFALANHLHRALAQAHGRVVNVATGFLGRIRLNVQELVNPPSYGSLGSYSRAKLASVMMTLEQAERWKNDNITAVAVQPGIVMGTRFGGHVPSSQSLVQSAGARMLRLLGLGATLDEAAERYRVAAFDALPTGTYYAWGKVTTIPQQAQDASVRRAVWELLEQLTSG